MRRLALLSSCVLLLLLTGCALGPTAPPSVEAGTALQVHVQGGQQPVIGSHVYLFAANTTGYGGNGIAASSSNASVSLLSGTSLAANNGAINVGWGFDGTNYYAITDASGNFTLVNDYSCSPGQQLYLYAVGGNPGAGTNSAVGELAAVGDCSTVTPSMVIFISEVSTIATAYALAPFATDATHISTSGTSLAKQGIANAFKTVTNLETLATSVPRATTAGGNGTVPQNEIYYLANILAMCVNSTGPSSTQCNTLLTTATSTGAAGGTQPTDTATAAIYIAQNPGQNVHTLYTLVTPTAPFPRSLTEPNDWSISILYTGGGLTSANGWVAVDGGGNVWVVDTAAVSKFSPLGVAASSTGFSGNGLNNPTWIAIDPSNNAFVVNQGSNQISEFTSAGSPATSPQASPFTISQLASPTPLAIDKLGALWVGNQSTNPNSLSEIVYTTSWGTAGGSPFGGNTLLTPADLAIDTTGRVWVANFNGGGISAYNPSGPGFLPSATTEYSDGNCTTSGTVQGVALDASGNIWAAAGTCVDVYSPSQSKWLAPTNAGYTGGGISTRGIAYIAIDGAGSAWLSTGTNSVIELNSSGTPLSGSNGFLNSAFKSSNGLAIDGSGNLWVAGCTPASSCGNGALLQFVGISPPVVTPRVANLLSPYGSAAVNKP